MYNIAGGRRISILDLLELLCSIMNKKVEPVFTEPRKGEIRDSEASIKKAYDHLKWEPLISLNEGLARTVEFFQKNK